MVVNGDVFLRNHEELVKVDQEIDPTLESTTASRDAWNTVAVHCTVPSALDNRFNKQPIDSGVSWLRQQLDRDQ